MRVVLDTNVLVSGVFFGGVPGQILEAWRDGTVTLVVSPAILDEYARVGGVLAGRYGDLAFEPVLALIASHAELVNPPKVDDAICDDPDDDKFLLCAFAAEADIVVSGDRHLHAVSGWGGVEVLAPRAFVNRHIR